MGSSMDIFVCLVVLKTQKQYYQDIIGARGAILNEHFRSLENGFEFLDSVLRISENEDLKHHINDLVADMKRKLLSLTNPQTNGSLTLNFDQVYADVLGKMKSLMVINSETKEYGCIFTKPILQGFNFKDVCDFLLDNMRKLMTSNCKDGQIASLMAEVEELNKKLAHLKPLFTYLQVCQVTFIQHHEKNLLISFLAMLEKVTCCLYSSLIGITDEEIVLILKNTLCKLVQETDIGQMYLLSLKTQRSEFSLLGNLIKLLKSNANSLNDKSCKLYEELELFRTFLNHLERNMVLKKFHHIEDSIEKMFYRVLPIICTCYKEDCVSDGILSEVFDFIKHVKYEVQEIKLLYHPRTDGLGFLELFVGYLEELRKYQQVSLLKNVIDALYEEVYSLAKLPKTMQVNCHESLWNHIVHLVYQAEYVIDLWLVSSSEWAQWSFMSSLSNTITEVKSTREKILTKYLIEGEDIHVMPFVELGSTMCHSLLTSSTIVHHFSVRARCSLSRTYQRREVLLKILSDVIGETDGISELDNLMLEEKLLISLRQQKYLVILENVWDIQIWNDLSRYFPDDKKCSRVLIATKDFQDVALKIKDTNMSYGNHIRYNPDQDIVTPNNFLGSATQVNSVIVGFENDTKTVMEYLVGGEKVLDVISVVGMAGIGKTTLAMSLYKSSLITCHFDIQVWFTVSQTYQLRELMLAIINQANTCIEKDYRKLDDEELADTLCRSLRKNRYLIVLDDLWDIDVWNELKRYFPDDKQGSRILITTRHESIASKVKSKLHALCGLTNDESLELLKRKLLVKESLSANLLSIAKEIAENCKGLPLTIVIVAGLLKDVEKTENKWNQIARSVSSHVLADPHGKCKAILELSYNNLPDHLRSCFLYLGAFPEDREIVVSQLIRLWISEGMVRDTEMKSSEDMAEEYITDLIARNLVICVQERSQGGVKTCRLHGLLRDFCLEKAKDENFMMILDMTSSYIRLKDPRRLIINSCANRFINFSYHSTRSIIFFEQVDAFTIDGYINYHDMELLQLLDARKLHFIPTCISRLIHLRYLAAWIKFGESSDLLSSIMKLRNLQILIIEDQKLVLRVLAVPDSLWDMVKLRQVHIRPIAELQADSLRIQNSTSLSRNLRSLSRVSMYGGNDFELIEKLPTLEKLNCIYFGIWDESLKCCTFPASNFGRQLTSLKVEYGGKYRMKSSLHLPQSLKKLSLKGFQFASEDLSKIGTTIPYLEVLKLHNCGPKDSKKDKHSKLWSVNDEEFPRLKVLKLNNWDFANGLPQKVHSPVLSNCFWRVAIILSTFRCILEIFPLCAISQ